MTRPLTQLPSATPAPKPMRSQAMPSVSWLCFTTRWATESMLVIDGAIAMPATKPIPAKSHRLGMFASATNPTASRVDAIPSRFHSGVRQRRAP